MKLNDFSYLTDENIDRDVVAFLRSEDFDVCDIAEAGLFGSTDVDLMRMASEENRVIITHDSDFGSLAIRTGKSVIGILYLRPGHFDSDFTIQTLQAVLKAEIEIDPPLIIVARRKGDDITIRIRPLNPQEPPP